MARLDLLQLDLTDECPLFCSHCSNSSGPQLRSALQYAAAEQAIIDAADLGCRELKFSGGEPLRYADLAKLLVLSQQLDMNPTIFTTGIRDMRTRGPLSDREWGELKALGLSAAVFSVYSGPANRIFHNRIVRLGPLGARDAFEANQLGLLRARGAGVAVELQFLPSDETCSELYDVVDWAVSVGACRLHLQYPTGQGRNRDNAALAVSHIGEPILKAMSLAL